MYTKTSLIAALIALIALSVCSAYPITRIRYANYELTDVTVIPDGSYTKSNLRNNEIGLNFSKITIKAIINGRDFEATCIDSEIGVMLDGNVIKAFSEARPQKNSISCNISKPNDEAFNKAIYGTEGFFEEIFKEYTNSHLVGELI